MFGIKPTPEYTALKRAEEVVASYKQQQRKYERRLRILKLMRRPAYELKATRREIDFCLTAVWNRTSDAQNAAAAYLRATR